MFQMILGDFHKKMEDISKESLRKHNGDPFALTQDIFDLVCQISQRTDLYLLYQNLLSGMKVKDERASYLPFFLPQERGREMISFIDLSRLDLRQENDLFDCADILASLLKWAIVELFAEPARKAEISASFQNKIAILRRGMDPKQEETGC